MTPAEYTDPGKGPKWSDLAKELGVSRQTLFHWRKLANAPAAPDLEPWEIFVEENDLGTGKKLSKEREMLLTERVRNQNRLLEIQIAEKERTVVSRAALVAVFTRVAATQRQILYQALVTEYPAQVEGRTMAEIRVLGRDTADRICGLMVALADEKFETPSDDPQLGSL